MMSKRDILLYKNESSGQQRAFDRWLKGSLVIGSIFAALIVAMAVVESNAMGPRQALAKITKTIHAGASEPREGRGGGSFYQPVY